MPLNLALMVDRPREPRTPSRSPAAADRSKATRRNIRAGKSARRKREAYITQQAQATGRDEASIPVTHTGGQQRPLGTSVLWEPSSEDDSVQGEVVITEESNIVLTQQVSPAWLGPRPKSHPKLLQATPNSQVTNPFDQIGGPAHRAELLRRNPGGEASSSTSRPVIDLTQEAFQVIGNISTSDLVDGLRYCHPPPGVPHRTGNPGATAEAQLHRSVKAYIWTEGASPENRKLRKSAETIHSWPGATILAFDYHQVLDVDRLSKYRTVRIEDFLFPERHRQTLQRIRNLLEDQTQGKVKLVLVSHIHDSETNLRNLLNTVERSQSPFDLVLVTVERTGREGKLQSLKDLAPGGRFAIFDDNQHILEEFERSHHLAFQVRKPGQRAVLDWNYVTWSISEPWIFDRIAQFVRFQFTR